MSKAQERREQAILAEDAKALVRHARTFNPFLAALCIAVQDAKREGYNTGDIRDSLNKFINQLVGDGTVDVVMTSEWFNQAKELSDIEVEAIDPEK
jgi:hypothetical protein